MLKKFRNVFFYVVIIGSFSTLIYWIAQMGTKLEVADKIIKTTTDKPHWLEFLHSLLLNLGHPLAILLAQIVTIILAARIFGWICKKIGQPSVIGEIIAGRGDELPVSAFPVDGTWPTGTTQYERRNIALEIPVWDEEICIQCGKCFMVCPHATIRAKVYDPKYLVCSTKESARKNHRLLSGRQ